MAVRMKRTLEQKQKMRLIVECISERGDIDALLNELNMTHFARHHKEVYKIFGSGCFLKSEIAELMGQDFDQLFMLNEKLEKLNVMSNGLHRIDIIH
ncbi:hypothetical protein THF1C08_50085 [Vibrio jasicida]|jgi:hydroxyethylthiazole kinase-like sugar kinase family protein|uniref:Uncharacterized protein n=2 Tax=Vibrio harveyi group TaxID=717610 RepID=A0AAU9QUL9_9VIBR|nr:hypothetical protein THF1C08_50085 [Vibrio jasicida]CAH1601849.1 hypothetical protein THF1A12_50263 [Vibrio jasicida]